ncbi:MAG: two-component system response regulator [Terriglobales bacterium]
MSQVLLVDDDPIQLRVREQLLRGAGFSVTVATSAETAWAVLQSAPLASHVGVIITDHLLPGMSGAEFVRHLRQNQITVPVVVLSGLPDVDEEYRGLDVAFRSKPCPPGELIALVRTFVQRAA